ncbi:hypothetical protein Tco_0134462 [Tanacetum coccineum]
MGIMSTKIELVLEQSQQDVSNEVLNIRVIPHNIHSDDGNPSSVNIKQALCLKRASGHGKTKHELTTQLYDESDAYVLEDSMLQAGNPVKEILPN